MYCIVTIPYTVVYCSTYGTLPSTQIPVAAWWPSLPSLSILLFFFLLFLPHHAWFTVYSTVQCVVLYFFLLDALVAALYCTVTIASYHYSIEDGNWSEMVALTMVAQAVHCFPITHYGHVCWLLGSKKANGGSAVSPGSSFTLGSLPLSKEV